LEHLKPLPHEALPEWSGLKEQQISDRPFWWGGKGKMDFPWRTSGVRSFLGISEPTFRAFKTEKQEEGLREEHYFGLWDKEQMSLVIARDDLLVSFGTPAAEQRLLKALEGWVRLGMPGAASLKLSVYPIDVPLTAKEHEWVVKRTEAQFLWSLPD
jgi:hypothetical protein